MYNIMPRAYKRKLDELLIFSGSKTKPHVFTNYSITLSIVLGFVITLAAGLDILLFWPILTGGFLLLFHGFLVLAVDKRTAFVESILPDALQIVAANIRSGFIPSRAILLSARKEFGPLTEAIRNVGKEMLTGKSLQESLDEFTRTIRSDVLERTVILLKKGTIAGGQLVSLFEETAKDMRRRETIKKEVKANILMYAIFIGFAGCVGAPMLYGLSTYLVVTISKMGEVMYIPEEYAGSMPLMASGGIEVSADFLMWFSIIAIVITSLFGGLLIGLISTGKEKSGIKFVPILLVLSLIIFFVTRSMVGGIFTTFVPI
jgi:flagellar protein FlaJ